MRKLCLIMTALSCLVLGCSSENVTAENVPPSGEPVIPDEIKLGESCPDNTNANYANDEYSALKHNNESLKLTLRRTGHCDDNYPICRETQNDVLTHGEKYYCARCKPGEVYGKDDSGKTGCFVCNDLSNENCSSNECAEMLNRCSYMLHGEVTVDYLSAEKSIVTLYYDNPRTVKMTYKSNEHSVDGVKLKIVDKTTCANTSAESLVTDKNGDVFLKVTSGEKNCDSNSKVKICLEDNGELCASFTVRKIGAADSDELDTNHNLMIDEFETNSDEDKNKYTPEKYSPGKCDSYCHDDADCEDFCDSAIGYRCSKRCTSDEQCLKYKDDGKLISMICREDGRCAYPSFKAVYKLAKDNTTVRMGGQPTDGNEQATIDWGDGSEIQTILADTMNNLRHTYKKSGQYTIEIKGEYSNWTAGCAPADGIDLIDVIQFGPIGLGWFGDIVSVDEGSFTNCTNLEKMSAKDIPDSTKLTNMNSMFTANNGNPGYMFFNAENSVSRWDTSNVTTMYHTFMNTGDGDHAVNKNRAFNQDITRWNVSKVRNMEGMFLGSTRFNQNIQCWDVSSVEDISYMFWMATGFNQNLGAWDLSSLRKHTFTFRCENGHNGIISLKNYCALRNAVPEQNKNIGRDGGGAEDPCRFRAAPYNYGSACCAARCHRNPNEEYCKGYVDHWCGTALDGYNGYDYGDGCNYNSKTQEYGWGKLVNNCLSYLNQTEEFANLTEDDVTCHHIRVCRDCAFECYKCSKIEGCDIHSVKNISDAAVAEQKKQTGRYDMQIKCECDHILDKY